MNKAQQTTSDNYQDVNTIEITLKDIALKSVLSVFEGSEKLELFELGDTWHPNGGFVDETSFTSMDTIADWLMIDYDFKGLISFRARVGNFLIRYLDEVCSIRGDRKEIEKLRWQLVAANKTKQYALTTGSRNE